MDDKSSRSCLFRFRFTVHCNIICIHFCDLFYGLQQAQRRRLLTTDTHELEVNKQCGRAANSKQVLGVTWCLLRQHCAQCVQEEVWVDEHLLRAHCSGQPAHPHQLTVRLVHHRFNIICEWLRARRYEPNRLSLIIAFYAPHRLHVVTARRLAGADPGIQLRVEGVDPSAEFFGMFGGLVTFFGQLQISRRITAWIFFRRISGLFPLTWLHTMWRSIGLQFLQVLWQPAVIWIYVWDCADKSS